MKNIKVDLKPDILLSPGGYNGFYQLGICHYIKNNFDIQNKKILGFSAGSWAGLFLCLNKEHTNDCIKNIFSQINKYCPLPKLPIIFKKAIVKYKYDDFNISNLNIGLTNLATRNVYIHNEFLTINDCINSCIGSSFVPYITYKDILYFYKNKCVIDGAIYYKNYIKHIDKNKTLLINTKIFRPNYNKKSIPYMGLKKPRRTLYDLYLLGYNNARNNHEYLKNYLQSDR
jgi:hypothetical protein